MLAIVMGASDKRVPEVARACLAALGSQLRMLKAQILEFDRLMEPSSLASEQRMSGVGTKRTIPLGRCGSPQKDRRSPVPRRGFSLSSIRRSTRMWATVRLSEIYFCSRLNARSRSL